MSKYKYFATMPNPRSKHYGPDAGVTGWKLHIIEENISWLIGDKYKAPALCGLIPKHGWGEDLFIEDTCKKCERIAAKLGITIESI